VKAGAFEFRYRFWIFGALFWIAFSCYAVDHQNVTQWLLHRLAPGLDPDAPRGRHVLQAVFGFGALLTFVGAAIRTWATAYLRSAVVHDGVVHAEGLVADGPYRRVRNPLYLGTQLLMFGMAFAASRLGAFVLVAGGFLFHLRLIGREEAALDAEQGERFRAYCARVPRLLPRLTPRVPAAGRTPNWAQGFAAEGFMWLFGIALVVFAITLDGRSLTIGSAVAVVLYWVLVTLIRRFEAARTAG
jgi:protein-S-isoprenylcysteine O-methyltransferase Ste14